MRKLLLVIFIVSPVLADTVVLKNGLRVAGNVSESDGVVRVEYAGQHWTFKKDNVREILRGNSPREQYAQKAAALGDDAAGWYRLGLWAREQRLSAQGRRAFQKVLELDTDHRAARRALGYERVDGDWLSPVEAKRQKGFVLAGGKWLLPEEADKLMRKGLMDEAKVTAEHRERARQIVSAMRDDDPDVRAAAKALMDELPGQAMVRPLRRGLFAPNPASRKMAVKALSQIGDRIALPWLIRSSMYDGSKEVRSTAMRAVKSFNDPDVFYPYARAVFSRNPRISIAATRVLADLDDLRGVDVVLRKVSLGIGASGRANIMVGKQNSYIQDFDVEIAQAAAIGDPIVQTIRDGTILDYKVMGGSGERWIAERRMAYASALSDLTGRDFGQDFKAYAKYAGENNYPRAGRLSR